MTSATNQRQAENLARSALALALAIERLAGDPTFRQTLVVGEAPGLGTVQFAAGPGEL